MAMPEASYAISPPTMPSRKSRLEVYMWDSTDDTARVVAESFYDTAGPLASFGVHIPVAAHQESGNIMRAMGEYARQEGADPFSILVYMNAPMEASREKVEESFQELDKARAAYPWLDIRSAYNEYGEPVIGEIRKDLWDAAGLLALHDGLYDNPGSEYIGINHDIDTIFMGPHYMRNVQNYFKSAQAKFTSEGIGEQPMESRYTQVRHFLPFETHPNIARAIFWADFTYRQLGRAGIYEEGLVVPYSHYADAGGFDPAASTHETSRLTPKGFEGIMGTSLKTSPRRYIARLAAHGYSGIWEKGSFTATDVCRDKSQLHGDISFSKLEYTIFDSFMGDIDLYCRSVPKHVWHELVYQQEGTIFGGELRLSPSELREEVAAELAPRLNIARKVLERIVGSATLAQLVDGSLLRQEADEYAKLIEEAAEKNRTVLKLVDS